MARLVAPQGQDPAHSEDQASRLRALVAAHRAEAPVRPARREGAASVIAIASGKGGVGKTTLAVNLCIALARRGTRVTLVDADLGMANADVMCGLTPSRRLEHALGPAADRHARLADIAVDAPGGFRLVPGSVGVARMADLSADERDALLSALASLERESDLIVIDTGAGIGPAVLAMLRWADLGLVVATPDPASITDAYALMKCARQRPAQPGVTPPRLAIVINQAANPAEARAVHDRLAGCAHRFLGFRPDMLGWIPRDDTVARSVRQRSPFTLARGDDEPSRRVAALADSALGTLGLTPSPACVVPRRPLRAWWRAAFRA